MDEFSVSFTKDASNPARPIKSVLNATNDDYSLTYDQNANMVVVFVFCPMFLLIVFLFLPFLHRLYGVHSVYFLFVCCFPTLRFDSVLNKLLVSLLHVAVSLFLFVKDALVRFRSSVPF